MNKKLNIDCITLDKKGDEVQLMATEDNTSYINHATVNDINSGMIEYRICELKSIRYASVKNCQELSTVILLQIQLILMDLK